MIASVKTASSTALLAEWIILSNSGDPESTTCTVQYRLESQPQAVYMTAASALAITESTRQLITGLDFYTDYDVRLSCDNEFGTSNVVEVVARTGVTCKYEDLGLMASE